ncbi:glycerol kinase GlpK [Pelagicoccus sp. SDUM812003]|uniref:glycerol kinase GlpK n=1 Tax=Pelagicoccus sp. SDUM812003 TaxID=3041267 RepID=UPI00280FB9F3|nr:glycerol kinase GlpK [Pelagicoccus sp. SDUM812003]MDQ8204441.1 glycerol kinase GlpK [Pelagicoccus sp. SDUM812003]
MSLILSIDQGTTSSRAILFDSKARIVASDQYEFEQIFPRAGWVEHDAEAIWQCQWRAIQGALDKAAVDWTDVRAIGITNQRETVVAWHARTGKPIGNAIVWQDRRTAEYCQSLRRSGREEWIQKRTGLLLDPYFSASKMRWILRNREEARELAAQGQLRFGTIDSWLVWKLSAGRSHITDVSNASRTQLMDMEKCDWDETLLELFEVPSSTLPTIVDSSGELARTDAGLTNREIPISGIAGDQQAALFGQLCFQPGMVKSTYGTGCFILMNVGESPARSENRLLSTVAWRVNGKTEYALEGSVFVGGAAVQWLRDQLKVISSASEVEDLARQVEDSEGVVVVPAFTGLGAPYWDPFARGSIMGLTRGSSVAHIARATLDGIANQVTDVILAMAEDSGRELRELRADGGASANGLLMQIQADVTNVEVNCPKILETTAMGAAFLAGLAVGFWPDRSALESLVEPDRVYHPRMDAPARSERMRLWRQAVERCCEWEAKE